VSRSYLKSGLLGLFLVLMAILAGAPAPADARGRSAKDGSGASGKSGKNHAGHRHTGRHSHRSRDAGFYYWEPAVSPWLSYAPYPMAVVAPVPVQYIERNEQEAQPVDHWLYCTEAQGYFPRVSECPGGWERVPSAPLK